jgi:signal transduction histidine kinase
VTLDLQGDRDVAKRPLLGQAPFEGGAVLDGAANRVVDDIHRFFSRSRLERTVSQDERGRLAHELHDGLMQSLTGIALQLETVARLLETEPQAARECLRGVQELLAAEQQELRAWVAKLSRGAPSETRTGNDLADALAELCRRAEWQWGLRCEPSVAPRRSIPPTLGDHIYRIAQEGINNIGRHAQAQMARVDVQLRPDRVDILIEDDGVGFPFHGQYDLADLNLRKLGPRSLKERVSALKGDLLLSSSLSGSQLRICLPLTRDIWPGPARSSASA